MEDWKAVEKTVCGCVENTFMFNNGGIVKETMKITGLIENRETEQYIAEHGLCIHISFRGKNYLLDTGASGAYLENAKLMGIAVKDVNVAFLSHAHYDHAGGYREFFAENKRAIVYMQKTAKIGRRMEIKDGKLTDIGIPKGLLREHPDRFAYVETNIQVNDGVYLIKHSTEDLGEKGLACNMYWENENDLIPDDFSHEQSLVFRTGNGLVVLNSCCHAGVENVIEEVLDAFPSEKIAAMIGGFHLMGQDGIESMGPSEEEVQRLGERLAAYPVRKYYTGHCTGIPAFRILKDMLNDRLDSIFTGKEIVFQ